jgi:hypothetical protein
MYVSSFFTTFQANRKLTYDLLQQLDEGSLCKIWPRPGLDTFSKHFQEMAMVQEAFVQALASGKMDFARVPDVFSFSNEVKSALNSRLGKADDGLATALKGDICSVIDWEGMPLPVEQHLVNLISHEVFHQGMMAMAIYMLRLPMPESWVNSWALPASRT